MVLAVGEEGGNESEDDVFAEIYSGMPSQRSGVGYERGEEPTAEDERVINETMDEEDQEDDEANRDRKSARCEPVKSTKDEDYEAEVDDEDEFAWNAAFGEQVQDEEAAQREEDEWFASLGNPEAQPVTGGADGEDAEDHIRDGEDAEDHIMEETQEEAKISAAKSPVQPTREEMDLHRLTHWPFRDWCEICVAARGKEEGHFRKSSGYVRQGVPTVCLDYKELRKGEASWLVLRDQTTRFTTAHKTICKGPGDHWLIMRVIRDLENLGYTEI